MNYRIEQLRFLLREDPSSRVFYQLAELLRKEGQLSEAVEILRQGLDRHPRYLAAWVSLGRAQMGLESIVEAEGAFHRALDLDPQNAVAARMIGETAIALKDWPRATKALKLARELAPSDLSLDEKIAFVELQMSGGMESPLDPAPRSARPDTAAIRAPEVISLSAEDPFAVASAGDTGVWRLTQEVFGTDEDSSDEEAATLPADFLEPETVTSEHENEVDHEHEDEQEQVHEHDHDYEHEVEPEAEPEPQPERDYDHEHEHEKEHEKEPETELELVADDGPDGGTEEEHEPSDALPLPTMTLARLAMEQGDVELAENTLGSLLERDPDHPEAAELLEKIHRDRRGRPAPDIVAAKVATLQEWLDTVRRAAERLNR